MSVTLAMDVTYLLLLSSLGLAVNTQAQDCPVPVGGNNMGFKDTLPTTFPNGIKVSFECNVGYQSAGGSSSITCTNGTWSPVKLKCERKSCGNLGDVANGNVEYHGVLFGDKLVVTCNTGYHIIGNGQISCGDKGWLGRLPTCEAVACSTPELLTNGSFSPFKESYNFPEAVQYECQKDYTMSGSRVSSCSADGTFKPAPPTCIMVKCEEFNLLNGEVLGGSRPPYKYQSTVNLGCHSGYIMKGDRTQRCDLKSQWAPGLPTCEPVQCDDPDIKHAATEGGSMPPYTFKSTVTFSCISGYTMKGVPTQTCGPNGQWTPGLPTCEHGSDSVDPPGNNGNRMAIGLGLGLTALVVTVTALGFYFFGVPAFIKDKKRSRRGVPENVASKADEEVALS